MTPLCGLLLTVRLPAPTGGERMGLLPGGWKALLNQDWVLGAGFHFRSSDSAPKPALRYVAELRKAPQLLLRRPRLDVLLTGKATAAWHSASRQVRAASLHGPSAARLVAGRLTGPHCLVPPPRWRPLHS